MNRIVLAAQILGALVLCIAATAIADPGGQGEIKRVLKAVPGDEPGTLKGNFKWADVTFKMASLKLEGGRTLSESKEAAPSPAEFKIAVAWESLDRRAAEALNRAIRGMAPPLPAELDLGARKVGFQNALITEVAFPALDGASKEPAYLTLKISAQPIPTGPGTPATLRRGGPPPTSSSSTSGKQKQWLPSNFRLRIDRMNTSQVKHFGPTVIVPRKPAPGVRIWGDPHVNELVMPERDFRLASLVKWEGPDFDASKSFVRPRDGQILYMGEDNRPMAALKFRIVGVRRVRATEGGLVVAQVVMDQFEIGRL